MLTSAKSAAIHLSLIMGMPEPQAAKLAGAPEHEAKTAILTAHQNLRGKLVNFNKWLKNEAEFHGDSVLFSYEVHLARLEFQHNECIVSWLRTKEHADKLYERFSEPVDETGKMKKPYIGDIRFLQLARHIRREMDKVEQAISERMEQLSEQNAAIEAPAPASHLETQVETTPELQEGQPVKSERAQAVTTPQLASLANSKGAIASQLTASMAGSASTDSASPKPWRPKQIPVIQPPPRKRDKYAGVNR